MSYSSSVPCLGLSGQEDGTDWAAPRSTLTEQGFEQPQQCFGAFLGGKDTEPWVHYPCLLLRSCGHPFPRLELSWAEGSSPEASGFALSVLGVCGLGAVEEVGLAGASRPGSSIGSVKKRFQPFLSSEF